MKKLGLLILLIIAAGCVQAKSYTLDKADVSFSIMPDGLVHAKELITFRFSGQFSYAYRDIDTTKVDNIAVYDYTTGQMQPLQFEVSDTGAGKHIKWYYTATDTTKVFLMTYDLKYVVQDYSDVAEFYWKVWGAGWDHSLADLEGRIVLPTKTVNKDVYTWGHPNLNGKIGILDNQTIVFQAFNIPAYQWVEVRAVFPTELITSQSYTQGRIPNTALNEIVTKEQNYVEPMAISTTQSNSVLIIVFSGIILLTIFIRKTLNFIFPVIFVGLGLAFYLGSKIWESVNIIQLAIPSLLVVLIFLFLYFTFGREPRVELNQMYEREIPYDYSPAIVSSLINEYNKKPTANDYVAVILNLCLKGKLKLEVVKKKKILGIFGKDTDYNIVIMEDKKKTELEVHEQIVFDKVAEFTPYKGTLTFSEFTKRAQQQPTTFRMEFVAWQKEVNKEAIELEFFAKQNAYLWFNIGSGILAVTGFLIFRDMGVIIAGIVGLIVNNAARNALPRRTAKGQEHYKRWMNLKKYLGDFSAMKEHPPESIVVWEKYLVYAVTLGVADKVEKAMKLVIPNTNQRSALFVGAVNYQALGGLGFASAAQSFSTSFAAASHTSGGGGFSGGGGGGGGGEGGGAG